MVRLGASFPLVWRLLLSSETEDSAIMELELEQRASSMHDREELAKVARTHAVKVSMASVGGPDFESFFFPLKPS